MVENIKAMPDVGIFAGCFLGSSVGVLNAKQRMRNKMQYNGHELDITANADNI